MYDTALAVIASGSVYYCMQPYAQCDVCAEALKVRVLQISGAAFPVGEGGRWCEKSEGE